MQDQQPTGGLFNGSPKAMFLLGLFVGVSSVTIIGLSLVVGMFVSGKGFGSAALAANNQPSIPSQPTDPSVPTAPAAPVKPVDEKNDHIRGAKNAKVTLIEYSDYECPFCLRHEDSITQALKDYPNDVRVIYRNFPLTSIHPEAQKAAEAAECAGQQGKFWEMHDAIFQANAASKMSVATWKEVAGTLKIDTNKFNECLDGGKTAAQVAQEEQEGSSAGVQGTPGTFVNGTLVEGAVPYATLKSMIDSKLQG
ncbi:MAG: DsbA family protein [Patescibacteria group bacterium]